jgi:hypothetical protein
VSVDWRYRIVAGESRTCMTAPINRARGKILSIIVLV